MSVENTVEKSPLDIIVKPNSVLAELLGHSARVPQTFSSLSLLKKFTAKAIQTLKENGKFCDIGNDTKVAVLSSLGHDYSLRVMHTQCPKEAAYFCGHSTTSALAGLFHLGMTHGKNVFMYDPVILPGFSVWDQESKQPAALSFRKVSEAYCFDIVPLSDQMGRVICFSIEPKHFD